MSLQDDIQRAFVKEVERVARDPIYWVRREASFAFGALAKVVPEDVIISLVGFLKLSDRAHLQIRLLAASISFVTMG